MTYYSTPKLKDFPWTLSLIILNVVIFLFELFTSTTSGAFFGNMNSSLIESGGLYPPAVIDGGQWYRLFSSMFLHAGILHIFFNMLTLWSVGPLIEKLVGKWKYLLIYVLSGLGGSLFTCLVETARHSCHLTVGASGAIFGLFGALLGYGIRAHDPQYVRSTLLNVLWMLLPGLFSSGISMTSHIGGVLVGILLGILLIKTPKPQSNGNYFVDYS